MTHKTRTLESKWKRAETKSYTKAELRERMDELTDELERQHERREARRLETTATRIATHGVAIEHGNSVENQEAARKLRAAADELSDPPEDLDQKALELTLRFLFGCCYDYSTRFTMEVVGKAIDLTVAEVRKYWHSWEQLEPKRIFALFEAHAESEMKKSKVEHLVTKGDLRKGL